MRQQATRPTAEENRAFIRERVAVRGWQEEIEAEAEHAYVALLDWNAFYFRGYTDGANKHHLSARRLDHYAHCYADVSEQRHEALRLEEFWSRWEAGEFETNEIGTWHERRVAG